MTTREEATRLADALDAISAYSDSECATLADAAALLRQWPEVGWMPIESAPKDGGMFLVWIAGVLHGETDEGQLYQQEEGQVDFAQWRTFEDGGYVDCFGNSYPYDQWDATHWMPLPAAPGAAPSQQPAPEHNEWREAVLDQLAAHALDAPQDEPPAVILRRIIDMALTIALDPAVSSDAQALIDRGAAQQPAPARPDEFVCPHCFDEGAAPQAAQSGMVDERWVIVRETVLDVGRGGDVRTGGRPELGYALISDAATYPNENAAREALQSVGLPLGWVIMPLSRLLPDLQAAPRAVPNPCAKILEHKWLDPECVEGGCKSLAQAVPQPQPLTDEQLRKLGNKRAIFQAGRNSYQTPAVAYNTDDEAWDEYLRSNGITAKGEQ